MKRKIDFEVNYSNLTFKTKVDSKKYPRFSNFRIKMDTELGYVLDLSNFWNSIVLTPEELRRMALELERLNKEDMY
jgi:hypothetical protein